VGRWPVAGSSISIDDDFFAKPTDSVQKINSALAQGQNLLFTPGIYYLDRTIKVKHPDTVVLGLGFPTLVSNNGVVAISVADVPGVKLSGLLFDAGPLNSPVLLQVGTWKAHKSDPDDPTLLSDVFFRIGGATAGKATISLLQNLARILLAQNRKTPAHPNECFWCQLKSRQIASSLRTATCCFLRVKMRTSDSASTLSRQRLAGDGVLGL
jgi:hypothetical protein